MNSTMMIEKSSDVDAYLDACLLALGYEGTDVNARLLAMAILAQACEDARLSFRHALGYEARRWVRGIMCEEVCRVAEIPVRAVRAQLKKEGVL